MHMLVVVIGVDLSLLERFGLIERGGGKEVERCVRTEIYKVLWEFFSSKTRTTRTNSFPYDHSLVCSLVKCFLTRKGGKFHLIFG